MRALLSVLCLASLPLHAPSVGQIAPPVQDATAAKQASRSAFDVLRRLAGTWSGTVKTDPPNPDLDGPIQVTIRVASQGNLLVHEIAPGGVPEPTLIYLDGDRLMLVHYCDAGNRPRLAARSAADPKTVVFEFLDISGSTSPLYLQRFVFTLIDADHHAEDWTFVLEDNKRLHAHFDLRRAGGTAPRSQRR